MCRTLRSILCLISLLAFVPYVAHAQVQTGSPSFGSFGGGPDIINLANLNVQYRIPVIHKPGRGPALNIDLSYNGSVWSPFTSSGTNGWTPVSNWGLAVAGPTGYVTYTERDTVCNGNTHIFLAIFSNWIYVDVTGTPHPFNISTWGYTATPCTTTSKTATSTDGSGYTMSVTGDAVNYVIAPDGTIIHPQSSLQDRNGNQISLGSNYTDTLGVVALSVSGIAPNPVTYTYTSPSGAAATYTVSYKTYTIKTNFGCSGFSEYGPTSNSLLDRITLPNGTFYQFNYETTPGFAGDYTGRLSSVTLPTGSTISYTYTGGSNGIVCADGSTAGLTRTIPDGTWTYTRSIGAGAASTTTITAPKLPYDSAANQTVIQFQGIYETERKVYQGSATGTPLLTTDTCYNGAASPCTATAFGLPITQRAVITALPNNQQSKHVDFYSAYGLQTENDDYDFGPGAPQTTPLRKTTITYASLGNNIVSMPSSIKIQDGGGNQIALTNYNYDETAPTATSGLPMHASVSGSRGNLTSVSRWLNTTGGLLTSHITYYDTGKVNTASDPKGNPTTYSYSGTFAGAYPTTVTNALNQNATQNYDINTGVVASRTDLNTQPTSFSYDNMLRHTTTNYPDGGQTTLAYNDTALPASVTATVKMNSSQNQVSTVLLDGLGRASQTQLNSDPQGTDYKVKTYDALGRASTVYNPTRCSPPTTNCDSTWGYTSHQYDALGRTTQVTHPDSSTVLITYTSRASQVSDEGNGTQRVTRISQTDALGRLVSVCEVSSGTLLGNGGTPAACGQDISATGFLTTYQYDVLGNLLQVNQAGLNSRTFSYDSLSRLVCASNPENSSAACPAQATSSYTAGTTGYTYDAGGNLLTKTSPAPNQTGTATVTTTYAYDALNRLTQKSYNDSTTPTAGFGYDQTFTWGQTIGNPIGRMTTLGMLNGGTYVNSDLFSYDPMGRVISHRQCTPVCQTGQNGGSSFPTNYTYDLAGNSLTASNGMGVTLTYGFNSAAQLTGITSSLSDATHPASLLSSATYNPFGAMLSAQLGNGISESHAYNSRLRLQSSSAGDPTGGSATPGSGTVAIGGPGEQSKPGAAATPGKGSVTIDLSEQSTSYCPPSCSGCARTCSVTIYDSGSVSITVNGFTKTATYSRWSTSTTIASALASAFNGDSASPVTASLNSTVVTLTAKSTGSATNYSLSTSVTYNKTYFSYPSATATPSGSLLTGGANAGPTIYDSGTVSITVNGFRGSYNYGQNDTAFSIASGLASALGPSSVNASASGAVITLTAKTSGSATNYPLSTSVSYDTSHFSSPSFGATPSGSTLTGGTDNIVLYNLSLNNFPNGDVNTANDSVNGNWSYGYDAFNRVASANQNSGQSVYSYVYDRFGSRWQQNGPHSSSLAFDANNHIVGSGVTYDAAGNVINDGSNALVYDAENRVTSASNSTSGTSAYVYDAFGRRVRKTTAAGSVDFLYDLNGHEITEVSSTGSWNRGEIYAGARHVATYAYSTTYFPQADWLGTERVRINVSGGVYETCTSLPFGDWLTCSNTDASPVHFTGDERDAETGLDHTQFRQYTSSLARWLSPDPLGGSIANPQSLNRYAYVTNNPLNLIDPLGSRPTNCRVPSACQPPPGGGCSFGCSSGGFGYYPADYGGGGCTLDGTFFPCGWANALTQAGATALCVNSTCSVKASLQPVLSGSGLYLGTIQLPGYAVPTGSCVNNDCGVSPSWIEVDPILTFTLDLGVSGLFYPGGKSSAGALSDNQRIRAIARGVVQGAGVIGDVSTYFLFYGASAAGPACAALGLWGCTSVITTGAILTESLNPNSEFGPPTEHIDPGEPGDGESMPEQPPISGPPVPPML
jgi:RHS repeat-associated protein